MIDTLCNTLYLIVDAVTLNDPKSPRGIRGFRLDCGIFSEWRVQGKIGGYSGYPDKVRGILNEGGLFGERKGWHLPGFDTTDWIGRPLSSGLPNASAGAGFFVTTFNLSVPIGLDVFMSFTFEEELGQSYRAYLVRANFLQSQVHLATYSVVRERLDVRKESS